MSTVLVAGATGDLGARIAHALLAHDDVAVRVLTRPGSSAAEESFGRLDRVTVVEASYDDPAALAAATADVDVVVSALSGTADVILGAQRALLAAAVASGVPRFIPSDFAADYRTIPPRSNRNLELRREFARDLDASPIRPTSILNGAFTDMLTGQAPMIVFDRGLVLFWSHPGQTLDFTTKDDVAWYAAAAALDPDAPRFLEIAGDRVTARGIARLMSDISGRKYRVQWAGTTTTLGAMAAVMRRLSPASEGETFPAWQGMQYFVSMFSGDAQLHRLANERYGPHDWTSVRQVLRAHLGR